MRRGALVAALLAIPSWAQADAVAVEMVVEGRHAERIAGAVREGLADAGADVVSSDGAARIEGRVTRVRRRWRAQLELRSASGEALASATRAARQVNVLARSVKEWAEELGPQLAQAAPAEPEPEPEIEPEPQPERVAPAPSARPVAPPPEPDETEAPRLRAPFVMRAGFAVVNRSFTYSDDIFGALAPYELPVAPVVTLGVEWFPGGHWDLGLLSGLSVHAEGEVGLGLETVAGNGTAHATELWALGAGVRYRLRIDEVELMVDGGYRGYAFAIHEGNDGEPRPDVPNVEIHALRVGGGVRWDIGSGLFFSGGGAYLAPLAAGEIASEDWFPRASVGGVEADAAFGIAIDDIELRAVFAMRRFFYAMNPEPGDARVAGGAVDQSLSGALELSYAPR